MNDENKLYRHKCNQCQSGFNVVLTPQQVEEFLKPKNKKNLLTICPYCSEENRLSADYVRNKLTVPKGKHFLFGPGSHKKL